MGFNFKTTSRLLLSHKRQLEILSIKNYWILVDKKRTLNEVCRRLSLHSLGIYQWYYSLRTLGPFLQRLSRKCCCCFSFWSLYEYSNYPPRIPRDAQFKGSPSFFNKIFFFKNSPYLSLGVTTQAPGGSSKFFWIFFFVWKTFPSTGRSNRKFVHFVRKQIQ